MRQTPDHEPTFGYLSALQSAEHGYFGGYLLVSPLGRPLEFHCTAPIRPSRAQQILYGVTLEPFLLGEQIGGTLLRTAKLSADVVLVDHAAMLSLWSQAAAPVVRLLPPVNDRDTIGACREDLRPRDNASSETAVPGESRLSSLCQFEVAGCIVELPAGHEADRDVVIALLTRISQRVDLAEPFGRIHEAIREAQRIGGSYSDAYGEVA